MADDLNQRDLGLTRRASGRLHSDRATVDLRRSVSGDLATVSGHENLVQAILNRLFTHRGELAGLGHPRYGSRLHQLIGEPHNARTRGRAEIYLRECLAQERRIAEIAALELAPASRGRGVLEVTLTVRPVGQPDPLTLQLALPLEG